MCVHACAVIRRLPPSTRETSRRELPRHSPPVERKALLGWLIGIMDRSCFGRAPDNNLKDVRGVEVRTACQGDMPTKRCESRRSAGWSGHVTTVIVVNRVRSWSHLDVFLAAAHTSHPHYRRQPDSHNLSASQRVTSVMADDENPAKKPKRTYRACLPCRSVSFGTPSPDSSAR